MNDRPGREIPKEYRAIIEWLIDDQGWRYDNQRKGHPALYPADRTKAQISVPTTPGDRRSLKNFRAQVRRAGGIL